MKLIRIPAGNLCKMCGRTDYHFSGCPNALPDELDFHIDADMERMARALEGERVTMPSPMSREEFRTWLITAAGKLTNRPVIVMSAESLPTPDMVVSLGMALRERIGGEYRVVIQKPRVPGDTTLTFDLEETWLSRACRELNEPPRYRSWPAMHSLIMDELQSCITPRETEAWQGKPVIHKQQPVGRVADSVMSLINRAKKPQE